jgi:SAM-dependent methyltransferase
VIYEQVLEHILDIHSELERVASCQEPGGLLYVGVPGLFDFPKNYKHNFVSYLEYQHVFHFSLATLEKLLARHGYRLVVGDERVRALFERVTPGTAHAPIAAPRSAQEVLDLIAAEERNFRDTPRESVKIYARYLVRTLRAFLRAVTGSPTRMVEKHGFPPGALDIEKQVILFARSLPLGSRVLDVGCGLRPYEKYFAGSRYVGLDVHDSGRGANGKRADVYFDGLRIPFSEGEFDAVICTEVLEHCVDPAALTGEIRRVLRAGGRLLLTAPFIWGEHETPFDFRRYSTFGIRQFLEGQRFRILELGTLTKGIDAIERIVSSERLNFSLKNPTKPGVGFRLREKLLDLAWRALLRAWRRYYRFERIYLDVHVIAEKEND